MKWTRERILKEIRDRQARGQSLASGVVHREGEGLYRASQRLFGSWRSALDAAGAPEPLGRGRPFEWTREGILEKIREEVRAHPGSWRMRLLRKTGAIWAAGVRVFGGWQAALKAAGVVKGDGPVLAEGREVRLPCRRCGDVALRFVVKAVAQDMTCSRCGGTTRVEARLTGDRWEVSTR